MSGWEDEALNEEVQAFIEFDEQGCGSFQFGYVRGVWAAILRSILMLSCQARRQNKKVP
jgi:hypothetical protein